jgi:peroxiredoxin Q/BCP
MEAFARDIAEFDRLGAQVLGVSADPVETHKKFAKKVGATFPLLTDEDKKVRKMYGSGRITFVIDKQGIVRHIMKGMPDNQELLKELKGLK